MLFQEGADQTFDQEKYDEYIPVVECDVEVGSCLSASALSDTTLLQLVAAESKPQHNTLFTSYPQKFTPSSPLFREGGKLL